MPMYGLPPGLLAFAGAGSGAAQGGFGGALGGALQAYGQAEAAQADRSDRELQGLIQIARLEQDIKAAEQQRALQLREAEQAAAQQQAQQAFVQSAPQELQALAAYAPEVLARQQAEAAFREPDQGTSLMQNLAAAGLQPGTEEYQRAVLEATTKPQVQIQQGPKLPTGYTFRNPERPEEGVVPLPGGPADPANATTEQRNKLAQAQKTHRLLTGQIADYARSLNAGIPLTGQARDKIATQREQIKLQLKNLYELGAITGPDEDILNRLLIDPLSRTDQLAGAVGINDPLNERAIANLDVLLAEADRGLEAATGNAQQGGAQPQGNAQQRAKALGVSMEDLQYTARQEGMTIEQVLQELGG